MSETKGRATSRREFLRSSGRVVTASTLAATLSSRANAAPDNTIKVALVGCGGRGAGAAANALAVKNGPTKLVAMADVFPERLQRSYDGLVEAASAPRTSGSADSWVMGYEAKQIDVPPERRFIGFDAYQKAMDCLRPGDVRDLGHAGGVPLGALPLRDSERDQRIHGETRLRGRPYHPTDAPTR